MGASLRVTFLQSFGRWQDLARTLSYFSVCLLWALSCILLQSADVCSSADPSAFCFWYFVRITAVNDQTSLTLSLVQKRCFSTLYRKAGTLLPTYDVADVVVMTK